MPVLGAIIAFGFTELAGATVATAVAELGLTGVAASAASGAIIGGVSGGLSTEITGGNVGKGIIGGLVSGGVGGGVSNLVSDALGGVSAVGDTGPQIPVKPTLGGSEALGAGAVKGLEGFAGATTGALATGQPFSSALRSGLISGASGGISGAAGNYFDLGKVGTSALGGALGYGLNQAFPGSTQASKSTIPTQSGVSGFQSSGAPSALGSALFSAPGMSYSPGGPVLGGAGGEDKAPKNVWSDTDKSLRDVGSTVT